MEFIYDFNEEMLIKIIKNALASGYQIKNTEWLDNWERGEGCPSIDYCLDEDDLADFNDDEENVWDLLPEENKYGCAELNFVKDDDYISFYHIESGDEYIHKNCLCFLSDEEKKALGIVKKEEK